MNVQVFYTGDSWSLQHTYYIPSNGTWNASNPNVVARELMPGSPVSAFVFNATNSSSQVAVFYVAANSTIQGVTGQVGNSTSYYKGGADQWATHPVSSLNLTVSDSMFILACPPDSANSNSTLILYFASSGQGLRKFGWWATGSQWQSKELNDIPDLAPSAQVACQTFDTGDVLWASNGQGQVEQWWRSANESNNTWTRGMFLIDSITIPTTLSLTHSSTPRLSNPRQHLRQHELTYHLHYRTDLEPPHPTRQLYQPPALRHLRPTLQRLNRQ
jgi:hypothetical protein